MSGAEQYSFVRRTLVDLLVYATSPLQPFCGTVCAFETRQTKVVRLLNGGEAENTSDQICTQFVSHQLITQLVGQSLPIVLKPIVGWGIVFFKPAV